MSFASAETKSSYQTTEQTINTELPKVENIATSVAIVRLQ